ncbi:oligosaccharide flippase family protein [Pseudoduganella sp. DS3]|uniref:Oligosaccharide flippase family protein n=1 Tax=Pseudoduganella guangdongensis TaxID=2692179 RepID=A0A6N9HJX1_9BURK|nr:oligosaccharide flippase family protein [Pseudoduganella guangdongensis]MYN03961.1 oligosaccharide flippase family protein [Pseudoduganella guangdongensis]
MAGLARNFAYGFAEKYLLVLLALASSMLLARILSPAELGVYAIAAVLASLAQVFRDLGTGQLLVLQPVMGQQEQRALLTLSIGTGWALALFMALLAAPLARFYRQPVLAEVLRILALNFLLVPFSAQVTSLLRREMRAAALFRISACYGLTQFAATVGLAVAGLGPCALAWGSFAATAAGCAAAIILRPSGMVWRPALRGARALVRPGGLAVTGNAIDEVGVVAPDLVAGKLLGAEEVAVLGKAQSVLSLFNQAITSAVSPVVFPLFARTAREGGDPVQTYLDAAACITVLSWPFFLLAGLFAPPLVHLLYGPQWQGSVPLIRIMCGAAALYSMFSMVRYLLLATGHIGTQARLDAMAVGGRLLMLAPAGLAGLHWMAAAVALSLLWRSWLVLRVLRRLYGVHAALLLRPMQKSAIVAVAAMLPATAAYLLAGGDGGGQTMLLSGGAAAAVGWGLALWLQQHPLAVFLRRTVLQR